MGKGERHGKTETEAVGEGEIGKRKVRGQEGGGKRKEKRDRRRKGRGEREERLS